MPWNGQCDKPFTSFSFFFFFFFFFFVSFYHCVVFKWLQTFIPFIFFFFFFFFFFFIAHVRNSRLFEQGWPFLSISHPPPLLHLIFTFPHSIWPIYAVLIWLHILPSPTIYLASLWLKYGFASIHFCPQSACFSFFWVSYWCLAQWRVIGGIPGWDRQQVFYLTYRSWFFCSLISFVPVYLPAAFYSVLYLLSFDLPGHLSGLDSMETLCTITAPWCRQEYFFPGKRVCL